MGLRVHSQMSCVAELQHLQRLRVSKIAPHVLHVELNRPEKLNAMDILCWEAPLGRHVLGACEEIKVCFDCIARDVETRVVLISGRASTVLWGL